MKTKSLTIAVLAGILAISAGLAWFNHRSALEAESSLTALAKKRAAVHSVLHLAEEQLVAAGGDGGEAQAASATQSQGAASKPAVRFTPRLNGRDFLALIAADPKLYAQAMKAFRASLPLTFGPLFRALNLTPDQIDKFESLATQHQEAILDIASTASTQGLQFNDPAISTLMQQENAQFRTSQQALLGDAGYQQMQQFNRMQPVGGIVNNVASAVALTPTPLSVSQADQLSQILANASSQYQSGGRATQGTINWSAALGQAQGILTPDQLSALQGVYAGNQINQLKNQFDQQEKAPK